MLDYLLNSMKHSRNQVMDGIPTAGLRYHDGSRFASMFMKLEELISLEGATDNRDYRS